MDIDANFKDDSNSNETARITFLRDALYTHARQVSDFCQSGFKRLESYAEPEKQEQYTDFSVRALRLIDQLAHLITCARNARSLSNTINLEQLEAKAELLYDQLETFGCELRRTA